MNRILASVAALSLMGTAAYAAGTDAAKPILKDGKEVCAAGVKVGTNGCVKAETNAEGRDSAVSSPGASRPGPSDGPTGGTAAGGTPGRGQNSSGAGSAGQ